MSYGGDKMLEKIYYRDIEKIKFIGIKIHTGRWNNEINYMPGIFIEDIPGDYSACMYISFCQWSKYLRYAYHDVTRITSNMKWHMVENIKEIEYLKRELKKIIDKHQYGGEYEI